MDKNYKVINDLKLDEGFRSKPYKDTRGFLTIGHGINISNGITEYESAMILEHRVNNITETLKKQIIFWHKLNIERQNVLINMAYNLGVKGLINFKKMLIFLSIDDYKNAAKEGLDSAWAKQVPNRARKLMNIIREGK